MPAAPAPRRTPGRARPAALLAAGAATAALAAALVPALGSPAAAGTAAGPSDRAAAAALATPSEPPAGRAWIEGTVVDRAGRPIDGLVVQAYDALAGPDAEPVASWLTYADPADGPAHGFFRLYVPRTSSTVYEVRFSSPEDSTDPYRERTLDDALYLGGGPRSEGIVKEVGETVMTLQRRADATVALKPSREVTKPDRRATMAVSVTSPDVTPVTGPLTLRVDGKDRARQALTASSGGRAVFRLPELKPGRHTLQVRYAGSDAVLADTGTTKVTVEKPRKPRGRR